MLGISRKYSATSMHTGRPLAVCLTPAIVGAAAYALVLLVSVLNKEEGEVCCSIVVSLVRWCAHLVGM